MFIRCKRRQLKRTTENRSDWHALDFVLVRSVRTPAGPRQKIIGYLGSVEERLLNTGKTSGFYRQALPRLRTLAGDEFDRLVEVLEKILLLGNARQTIEAPKRKEDFKVW